MIIENIIIDDEIAVKIHKKHKVTTKEIRLILEKNEPVYRKVCGEHYMAIGLYQGYLTIFFIYNGETKSAYIQTAYKSSKWQIKLYRKKKK